jgi:hypothetical protein
MLTMVSSYTDTTKDLLPLIGFLTTFRAYADRYSILLTYEPEDNEEYLGHFIKMYYPDGDKGPSVVVNRSHSEYVLKLIESIIDRDEDFVESILDDMEIDEDPEEDPFADAFKELIITGE